MSAPAPPTPAPAPADPERERIAAALPNYEVGAQLGKGGWGVVYEGRHRQLGREVAIKQLPAGFSTDADVRARFMAEARTLAALDHPHVVPVYDYVEHEGLCLLVMEKLSGGTVWSRFASEGLSMEAACAAVLATCAGLQNAHQHQILHRDIKPENLIFNAEGTLKVTDFGIAKVLGGKRTMATAAGEVIGTPAYMAPEQARGQEVTPATDVYAVGIMLYELLSGRRPFDDEADALALLFKHAYDEPLPLQEAAPGVPDSLAAVTMKALAKDPKDRYQSAEELGVAVAEAATDAWGPGWLMRSSLPVMAAGSIVAATQQVSAALDAAPGQPSLTVKPQAGGGSRQTMGPRDVDVADFVPVEDVVPRPPSAAPAWLGTVLLLAAVVLVAFGAPIGDIERSGDLPAGTVSVAGQDPSAGDVLTLDLAEPFDVTGRQPVAGATQVRMHFTAAGVDLGTGTSSIVVNPDGTFTSTVDATASRYLLSGRGTGELAFLSADSTVLSSREFEAESKQSGYLTAPFGAALLAVFFLLGYIDSNLRALRRGKRRVTSVVAITILAVPIGVAVSVIAWTTTNREPTPAGIATTAAVAAAAGLAAGWGGLRSGRRRLHKRTEAAKAKAAAATAGR
jgi:serine/threonine-protein kinase